MAPLVTAPKGMKEATDFKEYTLQLRQELGKRIVERLYTDEGQVVDYNLWMNFNKRNFMSLQYK